MSSITLDSIKYTGSALLMRGIQFLLIPIYTSYLSPYEYGIIDTITIIAGIVNLVLTFEIIQGMAWNLSDGKDLEHAKTYSSTALLFVVFVYLIFSIGSLIFSGTLSKILINDYPPRLLIPLATAAIATMGLFTVLQDIARWHLRATAHLTSAFVFAMASLISGFLLIKIFKVGIIGVFYTQLFSSLSGILAAFYYSKEFLYFRFDYIALKKMLNYSMPLVYSGIAVFINVFIDRIIVREIMGLDLMGIYGVAARFASIISILSFGMQSALLPFVFRNWKESATAKQITELFKIYSAMILSVIIMLAIFSQEIFSLFAGHSFQDGAVVFPVLMLNAFYSTLYIFSPGLFLKEKTKYIAVINIIGALINVLLTIIMTHTLGMIGAALAPTIVSVGSFCSYVFFGRKYYEVEYGAQNLAFILIVPLAFSLFIFAYNSQNLNFGLNNYVFKFVGVVIVLAFNGILLIRSQSHSDFVLAMRSKIDDLKIWKNNR